MQNTETDQGGGLYLAEGEHTQLVTGQEARRRRDARLNHCNAIAEYRGPVWKVLRYQWNRPNQWPDYAASLADVEELRQHNDTEAQRHFQQFQAEVDRFRMQADNGGSRAYTAEECRRNAERMQIQLDREQAECAAGAWRTEAERVR